MCNERNLYKDEYLLLLTMMRVLSAFLLMWNKLSSPVSPISVANNVLLAETEHILSQRYSVFKIQRDFIIQKTKLLSLNLNPSSFIHVVSKGKFLPSLELSRV